jgi:hypothetical protein
MYEVAQNVYYDNGAAYQNGGITISKDGNVAAQGAVFTDSEANTVSQMAAPPSLSSYDVIFTASPDNLNVQRLPGSLLNDSGSLYFIAHPNMFDIVDVQQGRLRLRFSLSETIANATAPLAVDSGGRRIYLITDKGLTIVDLGSAILSIGSLNPSTASPGTSITVRGSGFNSSTTATVGGQQASVSFVDENTLTLTVPSLSSGPQDILLTNDDGPTYTLQRGLTVP